MSGTARNVVRLSHLARADVTNSSPATGGGVRVSERSDGLDTFQFKALVQATLHHLGQYDTNGNWVGSNNGLLTCKYLRTSVELLHPFDSTDSDYLSNVPDFYSSSNDFRMDYTGAADYRPRAATVPSSKTAAYYRVDDWAMDAKNWTSGVETTNSLLSVTHWPVSGAERFFWFLAE